MPVYAIHISDLHLGHDLSGSVAAPSGQRAAPLERGHDPVALDALCSFLSAFHSSHSHDNTSLVISGDVSANGDKSELAFYKTLLHLGFVKNNWKTLLALRTGFRQVLEVPGNHDVWDGVAYPSPAALRQAHLDFFSIGSPLPARRPPLTATAQSVLEIPMGQHRILLHGLCSTSGCTPAEQVLELGGFAPNDVTDLEQAINRADQQHGVQFVHHFIVLHHSRADRTPNHHRLTAQAQAALNGLAANRRIKGILTGHWHDWLIDTNHKPYEVRCGTTLQGHHSPHKATHDHSLVVHEFGEQQGQLTWSVTPWLSGGTQFDPYKTFPLL